MAEGKGVPQVPQYFLIESNLAQAVMNYLGKQPYEEVNTFIQMMKTMQSGALAFPGKGPNDPGNATGNNGKDAAQTLEAGEGAGGK